MNNFRLPTIEELEVISTRNRQKNGLFINPKVFPCMTEDRAMYWSSTVYKGTNYAWNFNYSGKYYNYLLRSYKYNIRLVRSVERENWPELTKSGRWLDCGDGLAFDTKTGLQWKRYCEGQTWDNENEIPIGVPQLFTYDQAIQLFGEQ